MQPGSKNRKRTHKALTRNITARLTKVPELAAYFKRERFFFLSRYAKTCLLNVISVRTPWCANASKHLLNHHVLFWDIPPSVIQIRLGSVHHPCSSECLFRRPCERCRGRVCVLSNRRGGQTCSWNGLRSDVFHLICTWCADYFLS